MRPENLLKAIIEELTSKSCRDQYLEMKTKAALKPEDEAVIDQYFDFKIQSLVQSCQDVCFDGDETELKRLLSHIWIEYRMEWIRYNTQMQYQNILQGQADARLALRGASLSFLLGVVESYLTTEEIYWCLKLAADPINHLRSRTKLASRMVDITSNAGQAGQNIVENLTQLRDSLTGQLKNNPMLSSEVEKVLTTVEGYLANSTALKADDLHESFEMLLTSELAESPLTMVLSRSSMAENIQVPAATVSGLNRFFAAWLRNLREKSMESSVHVRRDTGKSDHLTVQWGLQTASGQRLILEIQDDGLGQAELPQIEGLPNDWKIDLERNAGQGSKVMISFRGTQLNDLILFRVQGPEYPFSFAVLAEHVTEILSEDQLKIFSDGSQRYVRVLHEDKIYALVDLAEMLFGPETRDRKGIFIKILCPDGDHFVLKATRVEGLIRDSIKQGPPTLFFIQGYRVYRGDVFSVVDIKKLQEVIHGRQAISKAA